MKLNNLCFGFILVKWIWLFFAKSAVQNAEVEI